MNLKRFHQLVARLGERLLPRSSRPRPPVPKHMKHHWGDLDVSLIGVHLGATANRGLLDNRRRHWRSR